MHSIGSVSRRWVRRILVAAVLAGLLGAGTGPGHGGSHALASTCVTTVSGPLPGSATWTAAGSPYCVTGNISVGQGLTLTVQPGVEIDFNAGLGLQVDGTLIARGLPTQPITFTASGSTSAGFWKGIQLSALAVPTRYNAAGQYVSGSIIQYATVQYAGGTAAYGALELDQLVLVDHSSVLNTTNVGIYAGVVSGVRFTNNTISANNCYTCTVGGGINAGPDSTITGNTISGNGCYSCVNSSGGIYAGNNSTITGNTISGNGCYSCSSGGIYAGPDSTITGNTISGNSCEKVCSGGGINAGNNSTITGNTVEGNFAGENGGGIFAGTYSTIAGNTISGNTAGFYDATYEVGGGIDAAAGDVITSNTVSGNVAPSGGGIYVSGGSITISATVISGNQVIDLGAGIYCYACDRSDVLQGNTVISNTGEYGVSGSTVAGVDVSGYPTMSQNTLCDNSPYDLADDNASSPSTTLNVPNNYWGTLSPAVISAHIYDVQDNAARERVVYTPILPSPAPGTQSCSLPDLTVSALSRPPAVASVGSSVAMTDTTTNSGGAPAGATTTRYYLSVTRKKSASAVLLTGGRAVPSLAAGQSSTGTTTVTIPATTTVGTYYVLACANDLRMVTENNYTNDCGASHAQMQVTPAGQGSGQSGPMEDTGDTPPSDPGP